jgi:hypothetical protein
MRCRQLEVVIEWEGDGSTELLSVDEASSGTEDDDGLNHSFGKSRTACLIPRTWTEALID